LIKFLSSFFTGFSCPKMVKKKPSTYAENRTNPLPKHSFFRKTKHVVLFSHAQSRYNKENRLRKHPSSSQKSIAKSITQPKPIH